MSTATDQARLVLEAVTHRYRDADALVDVSLQIEEGELLTLLGPSGCGKTTLLRIIAGFVRPTHGKVVLDGQDITRIPPHKRPVNMVFQRPTLFPHLDVFGNVAFGLRLAHVPRRDVRERVNRALALVRLDGFQHRRSHELSGGQTQRVALARALVNQPGVLLLDEPLSALDLKIRLEMEAELRRVHRETGATVIYVTHDQREALALSNRIAVLREGRVEQVGSPDDIYRAPASPFTARFVGNSNVIPVRVSAVRGELATVVLGEQAVTAHCRDVAKPGPAWLIVRPEVVRLAPYGDQATTRIPGIVRDLAFRGSGFAYGIEVVGVPELMKAEVAAGSADYFEVGSKVGIEWEEGAGALLPREEDTPGGEPPAS